MESHAGMRDHRDRELNRPPSRRVRTQSGNILVLFAIMLPLFLLCTAIVVDVGYWWVNGKKAQIAADSCALAAAGELPKPYNDDPECVIEEVGGPDYVLTNIPEQTDPNRGAKHLSTRVRSPYRGDSSLVEATVKMRVRTFFGRIVGLGWIDLTRRAVAERLEGTGDYAIYSHSARCPGNPEADLQGESLIFNGEDMNINGRVHSNGQYLINNADFWAKSGTRVHCGASINPYGSARFGGSGWGSPPDQETEPRDLPDYETWPEWWTPAEFGWLTGCDYYGQKIEIDDTLLKITGLPDVTLPLILGRRHIPPGTYCATELFKIGGNNLIGAGITGLAPKIEVAGDNHDFTPNGEVLFFAVPNTDLLTDNDGAPGGTGPLTCASPITEMNLVNGNGGEWEGKVFHPCGRVIINGNSSSVLKGAIYAYQVTVNGGGFNMIGTGGSDLTKDTALVE